VDNFRVYLEGTSPAITFSCPEAGRTYQFIKPLTNSNIIMRIDRPSLPQYSVEMRKQ
jgi:hypothetical protein